MPVALINPYLTLAELKDELKLPQADTAKDDELNRAINLASRWIDDYKGRDYFGHDHRGETGISLVMAPAPGTSPLIVDRFSNRTFGEVLFSPVGEVREIGELTQAGEALAYGTGFHFRKAPLAFKRELWRLGGKWNAGEPPSGVISIKGKFGFNQWATLAPILSGFANGNSVLAMTLTHADPSKLNGTHWVQVYAIGPSSVGVEVYSEPTVALPSYVIAESDTDDGIEAPGGPYPLFENAGSGFTGTVSIGSFVGSDDGTVQFRDDVLDSSLVPTDLPGHINLAAKLVAAALSGHNRKEVAGLDGQKTEIQDNSIPKTVFDLLGKRKPTMI